MDKRIVNTKERITDRFMKLLKTTALDKITVTQICRRANINRATFYKYYDNPYDLLSKIESEYINLFETRIEAEKTDAFPQVLSPILSTIADTKDLFAVLIGENGDGAFRKRVFELCYRRNMDIINEKFPTLSDEEKKWMFFFIGEGCNGILKQWIDGGMKESTRQVADFCTALVETLNKSFMENYLIKQKSPPPLSGAKGGKAAGFWACYLLPKFDVNKLFMCKPAVCIGVQ